VGGVPPNLGREEGTGGLDYEMDNMKDEIGLLRVLIIADDPLVRAGLATILEDQPGFDVYSGVSDRSEILASIDSFQADILLWDLGWDGGDERLSEKLETIDELKEAQLDVIALVGDDTSIREVWAAGVGGLLHRGAIGEQLGAAIRSIATGLTVIDPLFQAELMISAGQGSQLAESLTQREMEVLKLLAQGMTNKTIALQLEVSEHTVKFHINALFGKLSAQSRTEAVVRASRIGLILL
jgi:two-component system, NarL family, nitrate/nitrite response regulator NarL